MEEFSSLENDIENSAKRWKRFVEMEAPENEVFPMDWKNKSALQKLCVLRCLRPDRMTYAIRYLLPSTGLSCKRLRVSPLQLQPVTVPISQDASIFL